MRGCRGVEPDVLQGVTPIDEYARELFARFERIELELKVLLVRGLEIDRFRATPDRHEWLGPDVRDALVGPEVAVFLPASDVAQCAGPVPRGVPAPF